MNLSDLPTPCLILDRTILTRNIQVMAASLSRLGVPLRPHMKTAKCIEVARLATAGQPGGITVSTLAEAAYFFGHGISRSLAPEQCGGEGVGMGVQADHPRI